MSASRGTAIDRVLTFYRTASVDTVRATHILVLEVLEDRKIGGRKAAVKRGPRKSKSQLANTEAAGAASGGGN